MELENTQLDRRALLRTIGGALASLASASALTASPQQAAAAAAAAAGTAVGRRPGAKRSPTFLCDDAVSYLYNPTKQSEVWLVGTAHISNSSATLVENVIRQIKPQVVMVELDAQRVGSFMEPPKQGEKALADGTGKEISPPAERTRNPFFGAFFKQLLDPNVSVNDRITEFFAAALGKAISKMYESMDQKGLSSGQEFTIAINEARACGAKLLLGDRDVRITLRRLSEALRSIDLQEISQSGQMETGLGLEALDGSSVESINSSLDILKNRETMRKVVGFYKEEAPELYNAMIGERDKVMAVNLMGLDGKQVTVAVVGLAHVDGIEGILMANGWKSQRC
ncbi:conserved unknown protein [Ectocarpus siliculosus]|uniref:TraB family protein n=1 Tax=Ectocarpus siliculosus TaxID=2880 RepID=D7FHB1_ECTSI|nr:conserved unknown protein [Ectocarpus siliculosus]|eukprot:CBJ28478.1 conserved unknown protein [Ectocarpus siliculosus]